MLTTQSDFNNPRLHLLYGSGKFPGELLKKIFQILIESVPKKFDEIQNALQEPNWEVLVRHPHSLKSSCANIGLDQLTLRWRELEFLGKNQNLEIYKQKYPDTKREMHEVIEYLKIAESDFNAWYLNLKK